MRPILATVLLLAACGPAPDNPADDAGGNPCPCLMPDSGIRGYPVEDGGGHYWHAPDAG